MALLSLAVVNPAHADFVAIDSFNESGPEIGEQVAGNAIRLDPMVVFARGDGGGRRYVTYQFSPLLQGTGNGLVFSLENVTVYRNDAVGNQDLVAKLTIDSQSLESHFGRSTGIFGKLAFDFTPFGVTANQTESLTVEFNSLAGYNVEVQSLSYEVSSAETGSAPQAVPEPTTWALISMIGVGGSAVGLRKRRKLAAK